jgi:hypothetical protein
MLLKLLQKEYILINWATHQACLCVLMCSSSMDACTLARLALFSLARI